MMTQRRPAHPRRARPHRHLRRLRRLALTLVAVVVATLAAPLAPPTPPASAAVAVTGAGSTFAQIAIDQWRADVARKYSIEVNYSGQGSSSGRRQFIQNTVDWASSDIAFEPDEVVSRPYTYLPLVAGGTALMYNLVDPAGNRITNLKLSGPVIARIFTGEIRQWNHPDILADNADIRGRIPAIDIRPVVRSGGSGTSAVFTYYLSRVAPEVWAKFKATYGLPYEFTSTFPDVPGFIKQSGSDGIANFVANPNAGKGSIGYAEAGYALQRGLPMASVRNQAGNYTQPTARNVAVALTRAARNPDGTQELTDVFFHPDPTSYPISSYNYMIVQTEGGSPDKGAVIGQFIIHAITEGQAKAAPLGYSPLPPNLVQQGLDVVAQIPGAPTPPPLGEWGKYYLELEVPGGSVVDGGGGGGGGGGTTTTVPTSGPAAGGGPGAVAGPGGTADPGAGGGPGGAGGGGGTGSGSGSSGGGGGSDGGGGADSDAEADTGSGPDELAGGDGLDSELLEAAVDQAALGQWGYDEHGNLVWLGADGDEQPLEEPPGASRSLLGLAGVAVMALVFVPPTLGMVARSRRRRQDEALADGAPPHDAPAP